MPRHRDDFRPARALLASPYPLPTFIATPKPPPDTFQPSAFASIPPIKLVQSPIATQALHHGFPYNPNWKNLPPAIPPVPYPAKGGGNEEEREARRLRQRVKRRFGRAIGLSPIGGSDDVDPEEEIMSGIEEARSESGLVPNSATPVFDRVKHEGEPTLLPAATVTPSFQAETTPRTYRAGRTPFGWDSSDDEGGKKDVSPKSPRLVTPQEPKGTSHPRTASSISPEHDPNPDPHPSRPPFFGATNLQPFTFTHRSPPPKDPGLNYDSEASSIDPRSPRKRDKVFLQIPRGRHTRERYRRQRMEASHVVSGAMSDSAIPSTQDRERREKSKGKVKASHLKLRSVLELETQSVMEAQGLPGFPTMGLDTVEEETEGDGDQAPRKENGPTKAEETDPWTPMHVDPRSGDYRQPSWPHPLPQREGGFSFQSYQSLHAHVRPSQASEDAHNHNPGIGPSRSKAYTLNRPPPLPPQKRPHTRGKIIPVPLPPVSPVHPLSRGLVDPSLPTTTRLVSMPSVKACQNFLLAMRVQAAKRAAALREHNRRVFERAQREGMALCFTPGVVIGLRPLSQGGIASSLGTGMAMPSSVNVVDAGWTMGMGVDMGATADWNATQHTTQAQPTFTDPPPQARSTAPSPPTNAENKYRGPGTPPRKRARFNSSTPNPTLSIPVTFSTPQPVPLSSRPDQWAQPRRASENDLEDRRSAWIRQDRLRAEKMAFNAARVEAQARAGMAHWAFRERVEEFEEEEGEEEGEEVQMPGKRRRD